MLNYEISGNGKEHLVLLHGFMENATIWEDLEQYLSKDFTLIKIDLPGHGKSENFAEIHTMDLMAEKVKKVLDFLQLETVHLLGHSMGGYVSLAFAEKFEAQIKSLTLFFSTPIGDDDEKKDIRRRSLATIQENFRAYANLGIPNFFGEHERAYHQEKVKLAIEIAHSTDVESVLAAQKGMMERPDRSQILTQLEAKILIISGKYDNAVNVEKLLPIIPKKPNVKSYILDCGHNGHWEKPAICAAIINTELLYHLPKN